MRKYLFIAIALLLFASSAFAQTTRVTTSASGWVDFSGTLTTGQYNNGDYYVVVGVGTTTIVDREFKDSNGATGGWIHGCQKNPEAGGANGSNDPTSASQASSGSASVWPAVTWHQGLDQPSNVAQTFYNHANNLCAAYPTATIAAGTSVLIAKSCITLSSCLVGGNQAYVESVDVITFVSAAPACGSGCAFRPPYAGTNKTLVSATTSSIRFNVLPDWVSQGALPSPVTVAANERMFRRPWIFVSASGLTGYQKFGPVLNIPYTDPYMQGQNYGVEELAISLARNDSDGDKQTAAIRLIQMGIDIYGLYNSGTWFLGTGAHCPLFARPVWVLSASLLNNETMMNAATAAAANQRFCINNGMTYKYISQNDVDTPRNAPYCGSNGFTANDTGRCVAFTDGSGGSIDMRGRAAWHASLGDWSSQPNMASAYTLPEYNYASSPLVGLLTLINEMSLYTEMGAPSAVMDFVLALDPAGTGTKWEEQRFGTYFTNPANSFLGGTNCAGSIHPNTRGPRALACEVFVTHALGAGTEGSVSGGTPQNVPPNAPALVSPSSSLIQVVTGASITLAGTGTDSDGTVATTTATSTCDASVSNGGTATAWSFSVDLISAKSVCDVTITSTDDDAATAMTVVTVLRNSASCGLSDNFALGGTGTWPTPDPSCWSSVTGSLTWVTNRLQSSAGQRNFFKHATAFDQDIVVSASVASTVASGVWQYVAGRGTTSGGTYSSVRATAELGQVTIAQYTNGTQGAVEIVTTTVALNDVFSIRFLGTLACVELNGASVTDGVDDGCITTALTGTEAWVGCWGNGCAVDNFSVIDITPEPADSIAPVASFTTPATNPLVVSATPYTATAGTAADEMGGSGLDSCDWVILENPAENGTCTGTTSWTIGSIDLLEGFNTLQVTICDAATVPNCIVISTVIRYVAAFMGVLEYAYPNTDSTFILTGSPILRMTGTSSGCSYIRIDGGLGDPTTGGGRVDDATPDAWEVRIRLAKGEQDLNIRCMDDNSTSGDESDDIELISRIKTVTLVPLAIR